MITKEFYKFRRPSLLKKLEAELVIVGGGISGVCCAITAAREGTKVVLVQDRPVLGGNASSEVRLWMLGATSHMGNNNRWAREGGVIDEILVENTFRNREGNPLILDTILLEKVHEEPNITLLLNTTVYQINKKDDTNIDSIVGFCSQNSIKYVIRGSLFCDASGDGIIAFQAGASFRMGAESPDEFDEGFAPNVEDYGELLGHSLYFYTKDVGKPVRYVAPSFALKDVVKLPAIRRYNIKDQGCSLWWVEYGGRLDTIYQSEDIKWKLWTVIYGLWDHVKNSGEFPEAENLTLEWVGTIPGKRESRRFIGDYILTQKDVVEQRSHYDAVSFGGWALDLHPADGVFGKNGSCTQWHSKGVYQIPYRCFYSKDIENLFLAGRIISASHVAFGSSRVMATCAHGAQAVGVAAAIAIEKNLRPRDIAKKEIISELQTRLNRKGQSIHRVPTLDKANKMLTARIETDSELILSEIPFDGQWRELKYSAAQLLPLKKGIAYTFKVKVQSKKANKLYVQLRKSSKAFNYTPDVILEELVFDLTKGEQLTEIAFSQKLDTDQYAFLCFMQNENVSIQSSNTLITGISSVFNSQNPAVSNFGKQTPPEDIGIEAFEFWIPERRPGGQNLAMEIAPPLKTFEPENLSNGYKRPFLRPNAFVADLKSSEVSIDIYWEKALTIKEVVLFFDTDFDHPMESSLKGHPEAVMPFCVSDYRILNCSTTILTTVKENHQTINRHKLDEPIFTNHLQLILKRKVLNVPCSLFEVQVF